MSEEEIIKQVDFIIKWISKIGLIKEREAIKGLLDLYTHKKGRVEELLEEKEKNKELKETNKKLYELCQGNAMQEFINNECGFIPKSKIEDVINNSVSSYDCLKENLETLLYGEDCHR